MDKKETVKEEKKTEQNTETSSPAAAKRQINISWKTIGAVFIALFAVSLLANIYFVAAGPAGGVSQNSASEKVGAFIESNLLQGTAEVEIESIKKESGVYSFDVKITGEDAVQTVTSYMSVDGKLLFPSAVEITDADETIPIQAQQQTPSVAKSSKPVVELFVMSHCPYGTQAEKGMIPAVAALGESIDFNLRFVNYAMHGEVEVREQIRQYCIQEEQNEKLFDYLECFLADGDSKRCLVEAEIDEEKLDSCVESANEEFDVEEKLADTSARFPAFLVDDELNKQYGVSGSPTLVINGEVVSSARDPASYFRTICAAFTEAPDVCETAVLSSASPSSGFGYNAGTATNAQC